MYKTMKCIYLSDVTSLPSAARCRSFHDKNILQPTVLKDINLNDDAKISQPPSEKEIISENSDMALKFAANSSDELQSGFNHNSITNENKDSVAQHNDHTNNILLQTNGTNYSVKYSLNSIKQPPNSVKAIFEGKSLIKKNKIQIFSSDEEIERYSPDSDTGQDYVTTKQCEGPSTPDNDNPCFWKDFYSMITALKCKVCSFLCERTEEMISHMKEKHEGLMILRQTAEGENGKINTTSKKMKSLLDTNQPSENENDDILTLFACSYCNKLFSKREILMDHVTKVHPESLNLEKNCSIEISSVNDTPKTAMRSLATELLRKQRRQMSKVRCSVSGCCLKFESNEIKSLHEECHVSDKQLQCPLCKEKFSIWRLCSKHLWTFHNIDAGLYTCPICNKYKSNSPVAVMNHMDIHNIERQFICTECGKGFKQLNQLRNHALIHKKDDIISASSLSLKCTICERYFANRKSLKKHIECVHEKSRPFVCTICGHKTSRKAMLELHLRQHTGDKPYHCSHCNYKTGDHNCLRRHLMWHYGLSFE
ncbi:hypothetical protein WA026_013064 [Henosepilachna vigintioctopunctata]|uniref:C2H2-type domain-containing protein n=1 Tax=Henosepilachna vigintioctopunctata TaxID=420089 RepID=A0AAW1ULT8_9CUCU